MQLVLVHHGAVVDVRERWWKIPKTNICTLWILQDQFEILALSQLFSEVFSCLEDFVDVLFQTVSAFGFPHEPELQDISSPAALDVFITCIVLCIVEFVFLE